MYSYLGRGVCSFLTALRFGTTTIITEGTRHFLRRTGSNWMFLQRPDDVSSKVGARKSYLTNRSHLNRWLIKNAIYLSHTPITG